MPGEAQLQRRIGRGRLSSIDLLPSACSADVAQANADLRQRRMPQKEILRRLNESLAAKGIKPISNGAFNRHSMRVTAETRKINDAANLVATAIAAAS